MKAKVISSVLLSFIVFSVLVASCGPPASAVSSRGFTLKLSGHAWSRSRHEYVDVTMRVRGTEYGKMVLELYVKGGTVYVEHYGTFSVSKGWGILVPRYHYARLWVKLTSAYGGRTSLWVLYGKTGTLQHNTIYLSLYAKQVVLPLSAYPRLYDLRLQGSLALY